MNTNSLLVSSSHPKQRLSLGRELYPPSVRRFARSIAIDSLALWQTLLRGDDRSCRVDILLLHSVFPDEEAGFRRLLAGLARSYQFVTYAEAVQRIQAGRIDDRYLAFSFDDGLKCCLTAASILEEYGARSCFFVCPDIVGEQSEERIEQFCRERLRHGPARFMNWDDLARLQDLGHEIGGHTIGHLDLATVALEQVRENLAECRDVIQRRLGACDHFAWPFGRFTNFTSGAVRAVFETGFLSCASGERGTHRPDSPAVAGREAILRRQSIEANWRLSHVNFFLNRGTQKQCPWETSRAA